MTFSASRRRATAWGAAPLATLGLLLATWAVFRAPWPPDQPPVTRYGITVTYFERLQGEQVGLPEGAPDAATGKGTAWTLRRVLDGVTLAALLAGWISAALLFWIGNPYLLVNLALVGVYGAVYGGVVGLHPGPMAASAGFGLTFCVAGLTLLGQWTGAESFGADGGAPSLSNLSTGSDEL